MRPPLSVLFVLQVTLHFDRYLGKVLFKDVRFVYYCLLRRCFTLGFILFKCDLTASQRNRILSLCPSIHPSLHPSIHPSIHRAIHLVCKWQRQLSLFNNTRLQIEGWLIKTAGVCFELFSVYWLFFAPQMERQPLQTGVGRSSALSVCLLRD